MTDRELLELAAKAAGYMPNNNWAWSERAQAFRYRLGGDWIEWNPLTDDGDALRLAVTLGFAVKIDLRAGFSWVKKSISRSEPHNGDPYAATRRAIVRAAAGIERAKHPLDQVHQALQDEFYASISYVQSDAETYGLEEPKP